MCIIMEKRGDLSILYQDHQVIQLLEMHFNILVHEKKNGSYWLPLTDEFYPIIKIWLFFFPASVSHPNDLETILNSTKHIEKTFIYDNLQPWFGTGLLTNGGAKWHSRRKILTPTFHFNILQLFIQILIEEGENMTKSLKNAESTVVKDLMPFFSKHTLNAICETAMGTSLRGLGLVISSSSIEKPFIGWANFLFTEGIYLSRTKKIAYFIIFFRRKYKGTKIGFFANKSTYFRVHFLIFVFYLRWKVLPLQPLALGPACHVGFCGTGGISELIHL
ncbi:cytochrome P450 4c21-like isoform X3 [Temnothorax nylanderi]|uniref:cytochrome P450 4c21-like isoform X3 n=1 Tax=Temnothorax nylanderi TaxID=102681 RepID=UPI003A8A3B48